MKVLIVGGGGREHAIAESLSKSRKLSKLYCAPGNAGIAGIAECVPIGPTELDKLLEFALKESIDFTVVGMDDPLVMGIVDLFQENGLKIFGPDKKAAAIEGSKVFSKDLMKKYGIPTAEYACFTNPQEALAYVSVCQYPVVVKADGLALGKGVLICQNKTEAEAAIQEIMVDKRFGDAGNEIVVEEFLVGKEVSLLAFCDGKSLKTMVSSQDYKKAYDGNKGPNTGGMGTVSPSPLYGAQEEKHCMETIFLPTMAAMASEGRPFKGILYFGLIFTEEGPKVLEYNARFGDPETQVILPRLQSDLLEIMLAAEAGELEQVSICWDDHAACCVVLASGGYPGDYAKGIEIKGLEQAKEKALIYHAGTSFKDGKIVTNGGRVLGVTALGETMAQAIKKAYEGVGLIDFEGKQYRKDIGC